MVVGGLKTQLLKIVKQIKRNDGVAISRKESMTMMIIKKGLQNYWYWQSSSTDMLAATISLVHIIVYFVVRKPF